MDKTKLAAMGGNSKFEDDRAVSLVFTFREAIHEDGGFDAPEPDFLKWLEKTIDFDVMISGDEAANNKLPEQERKAWRIYCAALEATRELFALYKADASLFRKVAAEMMLLPGYLSRHADNERFNRILLLNSSLAEKNMQGGCRPKPFHLAQQSWPVRYAYAIITTIDLTLDTYGEKLPVWAEIYGYGIKHPIPLSQYQEAARKLKWDDARIELELPKYRGMYRILPRWAKTLENLRRPFNRTHVLDFWQAGKAMILEEMPDFHQRPEWEGYHRRKYKGGAKSGTIQHAIFKDILIALKTIAGSNHRRSASRTVTK